jgi:hypothetical protein
MPSDIASLLFALTASMRTMAVALPAFMGHVNCAARQAQIGVALRAAGWSLLLMPGVVTQGAWADRRLSTLSMSGIGGGLALNARAFDRWCGRTQHPVAPTIIAVVMPIGYCLGFSSYAFRVGWANGLLALQMGLVAATLWRQPQVPVERWRWLLVVALIAQLIVTGWRGVLVRSSLTYSPRS